MIKIPFDRCVILTTLDFEQISERLATAIYDPRFSADRAANSSLKHQYYCGQIRGFKFSASRIVGFKYFHLPLFLSPTIEGNINGLANGYEISLTAKLQNITFVLLLTWLGGLLTASSIAFEKVLLNIQDELYGKSLGISVSFYLVTIAYFYFSSWRTTRFFKTLFTNGLTGVNKISVADLHPWSPALTRTNVRNSTTK